MRPVASKDRIFALFILGSMLVFALGSILSVGIGHTPYNARDTAGRTMGFNDPLSLEHYRMIFYNFRVSDFFEDEHAYDWLLLLMEGSGLFLLFSRRSFMTKLKFWFFATQPFVFPVFAFGFILPQIILDLVRGRLDREGIIDIPFLWCTAYPVWVLSSVLIALLLWLDNIELE